MRNNAEGKLRHTGKGAGGPWGSSLQLRLKLLPAATPGSHLADSLEAASPEQQQTPRQTTAGREQAIAAEEAVLISDASAKLAEVTELR